VTHTPAATPSPSRTGGRAVAILAVLGLGLVAGWLTNWTAAAAILGVGLVVIARPFDLFVSALLVAGAAAFAEYGDPHIRRDLVILTALTSYALFSFLASVLAGRWTMPVSNLGDALVGLTAMTAIAGAHGVLAHHSMHFIFLETFPLLSLLLALAVGGVRLRAGELRIAEWTLVVVALASAGIGYWYFATTGTRTQGLPFSPVPGFVAVIVLTLTLFERSPRPRLVPVLVFCLLIGHQVISFTRGYWFALLAAVPFACLLYVRGGQGAGARLAKLGRTLGLAALVMLLMLLIASSTVGFSETISLIGGRFTSSFETKNTPETVSNIVRLVELRTAMKLILAQPWLGYGHGFTLLVRQFFHPMTGSQWFLHESYLMIWIKQGILGLAAFLWVLVTATRTGFKGLRHEDPQVAGWCAAGAAGTVFAAVLGLTNYYFFMVTQSFLLALVWGIALSFERPGKRRFVWRRDAGGRAGPRAGA
jgi:hypothetical protein